MENYAINISDQETNFKRRYIILPKSETLTKKIEVEYMCLKNQFDNERSDILPFRTKKSNQPNAVIEEIKQKMKPTISPVIVFLYYFLVVVVIRNIYLLCKRH